MRDYTALTELLDDQPSQIDSAATRIGWLFRVADELDYLDEVDCSDVADQARDRAIEMVSAAVTAVTHAAEVNRAAAAGGY